MTEALPGQQLPVRCSASICSSWCLNPAAWPFYQAAVPEENNSVFIFLLLFLSVDQIPLFGYFLNLLFPVFSKDRSISLWFCSFKCSAFSWVGDFSRHCVTAALSSSSQHKEEAGYRGWILFTELQARFPPGKQSLRVSPLPAGPMAMLCMEL